MRAIAWKRRIGIVGGLGPYAHVELERRLLDATERALGRAPTDQDFPRWTVVSVPDTPDRTTALLHGGPSPVSALLHALETLAHSADFAMIACNTAHAFLHDLLDKSPLPLLDVVDETACAAARLLGDRARVGLLASDGVLCTRVYHTALERHGLRAMTPIDVGGGDLQARVTQAIFGCREKRVLGVKNGAHRRDSDASRIRSELCDLVRRFHDAGADAVIIACTELPLVFDEHVTAACPLIDPLTIAANAAIDVAAGRRMLVEREMWRALA